MAVSKKTTPRKSAQRPKPLVKPVAKAVKVTAKAKANAKPKPKPKALALAPGPAQKPKVKTKLVRDSFTIPKSEYIVLQALKARAAHLACPAKKSEVLRAGINVLAALPDPDFFAAIGAVPNLKTGRPKKDE